MGSTYDKPHLSYEAQLERLESRGLSVPDRTSALRTLKQIGYYRLSAYLHTFRTFAPEQTPGHDERLDVYVPGSSLELVVDLWRFDRRLRLDLLVTSLGVV